MNSMSPSVERTGQRYESSLWFDSAVMPGVRYLIRRVSLARRIDLATRIRETARKLEFLEAGAGAMEQVEAAVLRVEMDRVYLDWALEGIEGLQIDGEAATPASFIDRGPIPLAEEILNRIKLECGLTEAERKN